MTNAALRARVAELEKADLAIQKAAMAMGSTDEWTDQAAMIWDFEERFEALRARVAELEAALKQLQPFIHGIDDALEENGNG